MDDFQWKTGRQDDRADFFSISLIRLGCLPFCMQIGFDYPVLYNPLFFVGVFFFGLIKLPLVHLANPARRSGFWHHEMAAADLKSHPVLHRLLLSPLFALGVCVCVYLSVTDKSRFGPPNRLCGSVESLGHVGCQGARKCPPSSPICLEELSVKMLPPNQSLMGHGRHEFGWENERKKGIHIARHVLVGWGLALQVGQRRVDKTD